MRYIVRATLAAFAFVSTVQGTSSALAQQNYPERPIRRVVPVPPGGSLNLYTRMIAQQLTDLLGQTVVVDNRPGANGIIGAELVAKATPDGYTLLMGASPTLGVNPTLYADKVPYDPIRDFTPITMVAKGSPSLASNPDVPVMSIKELIAYAKANPGKLNYGTSGTGSGNHLMGEMLKAAAGIDIVHVPYKGGGPALVALLAGQIDLMITPPPTFIPHAKAGRVRLLAVSSAERLAAIPDVPTIAESGFPGFEATFWYCVVGPRGLPKPVVKTLHTALTTVLTSAEFRERLAADAVTAQSSTPEELTAFIKSEIPKFAKVIRQANIKAN
jgi:tripartite-type tricarboxylate transporter receptor subunit TctC